MDKIKAQGAIEYLLLLGAAIVLVGIVVMAMVNTAKPGQETINVETYRYLCETLDTNTFDCGCYLGDESKGGANQFDCCATNNPALTKEWKESDGSCPTS